MKKRLKINGIIIACSLVVVIIFPELFFRTHNTAYWLQVLGLALILLGQIIRVSSRGYKAEHSEQSQALIQGGPYQVVRNPMYLGIFLIGLGVVLAIFRLWTIAIFILVFIIRYILLIHQEEKKLLALFPGVYQDYCRKVSRIIPGISKIFKLDISVYLPIKIVWFQKEIGSIVSLLAFVLAIEAGEGILTHGFSGYLGQFVGLLLVIAIFIMLVFFLSRRTKRKNG